MTGRHVAAQLRRLRGCDAGLSAIEFAFLAPVLIGGLLLMVDVGIAVGTRMEMDRNVRAGAQAAMSLNNSTSSIEAIMLASTEEAAELGVTAALACICAGTAADCTTSCGSGEAPSVFIDVTATRDYSGLVLSGLQLASHSRVQIR